MYGGDVVGGDVAGGTVFGGAVGEGVVAGVPLVVEVAAGAVVPGGSVVETFRPGAVEVVEGRLVVGVDPPAVTAGDDVGDVAATGLA